MCDWVKMIEKLDYIKNNFRHTVYDFRILNKPFLYIF